MPLASFIFSPFVLCFEEFCKSGFGACLSFLVSKILFMLCWYLGFWGCWAKYEWVHLFVNSIAISNNKFILQIMQVGISSDADYFHLITSLEPLSLILCVCIHTSCCSASASLSFSRSSLPILSSFFLTLRHSTPKASKKPNAAITVQTKNAPKSILLAYATRRAGS